MKTENLTRLTSEHLSLEQSQFSTTQDFLENARVKLAKVAHIKEMFPNLQPLQSPIYERAQISTQDKHTISTTLFAEPGTFCLQEKWYSHLSEL